MLLITEDVLQNVCDWSYHLRSRHNLRSRESVSQGDIVCTRKRANVRALLSMKLAPFVLVTIESDATMPSHRAWLDDPTILRWYSWNTAFQHPKLVPLPIGLNEKRNGPLMRHAMQWRPVPKMEAVLINFRLDRPWRRQLWDMSANWSFAVRIPYVYGIRSRYSNASAYYDLMRRFRYVACPQGLGIDTHRVWEALYLNVTPIVIRTQMTSMYSGLDVMVLDEWDELPSRIRSRPRRVDNVTPKQLDLSYWTSRILSRT